MFQTFLQKTFLSNTLLDYLIFIISFLAGIVLVLVMKRVLFNRLKAWAKKAETDLYDFLLQNIKRNLFPLAYFGVFYFSIQGLSLNPVWNKSINVIGLVLLVLFGVRSLLSLIIYILEGYWLKKEEDVSRKQAFNATVLLLKIVIWSLAVIFFLDNLGFKISALVAGLGVGGVAIAFASQAILGDVFNYFTIFFDKPFEVGDFIITGEFLGTIEHIGIKTTRIRSLGGEQLIFSNSDLTSTRLRNYKRMEKRRVVFKIGVTYQTGVEKLKEIPAMIKNIIESRKDVTFDRAHFASYGDFSLIFETVYHVLSSDYNRYMDIQQEINLRIKEEFEKQGIEFAYPTQTLFLNKTSQDEAQGFQAS